MRNSLQRFLRLFSFINVIILCWTVLGYSQTSQADRSELPWNREMDIDIGRTLWAVDALHLDSLHADTVIAVGDEGRGMKLANPGTFWTSDLQVDSSNNILLGVSYVSNSVITAVGYNGTITRSTDAGNHWISQMNKPDLTLFGVYFIDTNTGTAVGDSGTIFRTTNAGATWVRQDSARNYMLLAVSFADAIHGIAVGGGGKILKTIDGGAHWTTLTSPVTNYLYGVSYIDSTTATIVGTQGKILRTVDGGSTWTQQPSGTTSYFYGVSFSDKNTGMAVGENGKILFTTNGGSSWINKSSHTAYNLYGVVFFDTTRWYAVGGSGTIVRMGDTSVIVTSAPNRRVEIAKLFRLNQNYPNPFNPTTTMSFVLDRQSFVTLRVFDVLGREIETIVNEDLSPGTHSRSWSAYYLPSGVYFYRLEATSVSGEKHEVQTKKLLLLK